MKGLSHVAMGQFYEGIKAQTKVMLNAPLLGQKASAEYLKVKYLRGATFLHPHPRTCITIIHLFQWSLFIPLDSLLPNALCHILARLLIFLPEYSRYLHSHLDVPVAEYNVDQDLPGNFKNHWAKNLPFLIEDYEEQPGLQPHIK